MRTCLTVLLLALFAFLAASKPAEAWDSNFMIHNEERVCLIFPDNASFAVELAETQTHDRRTRLYIPRQSGLPGNSWYFIAVADNKGIRTKPGSIEGSAAAELVTAMLKSTRVRLGYSIGTRPLTEKLSISLDGFADEFWSCIYELGWENGDAPSLPSPATSSASAASDATPTESPAQTTQGRLRLDAVLQVEPLRFDENGGKPSPTHTEPTSNSPGDTSQLPPDLRAALDEYGDFANQKAFALAAAENGPMAWGYAAGVAAIEDAISGALDRCAAERERHGVDAECEVYLVGDAVISPLNATTQRNSEVATSQEPPNHSPIQYSNQWVEGREFVVGTADGIQVWVAFSTDGGPHAFVYLVNADDSAHTFIPEEVSAVAIQRSKGRSVRVAMGTFSAEAYENKEKGKKALIGALYGLSASLANRPQPTTSTIQGSSSGQVSAFGTGGYASGHYSGSYWGTITTWPNAQDYAAANARTAAQIATMNAQLRSSFDAMAQTLARRHTLPPGSYYGGIVRFKKKRAIQYQVSVPFGDRIFIATFNVQ